MTWNRRKICREFGLDQRTLGKRLVDSGLEKKDEFSSREVLRALQGDLSAERIRLTREQADKVELENMESRRELVAYKEVLAVIQRGLSAMVSSVEGSSLLNRGDKNNIITRLREAGESVIRIGGGDGGAGVQPNAS